MPVLINPQSGLAENLAPEQADQAIHEGSYQVPLNDPEGNPVVAPVDQARELLAQGYQQPSPDQLKSLVDHAKYSSTGEQVKTALEGAASAATFGLSTGLETQLGVKPEDIRGRRETNPGVHALGQIGGLAASTLIPGVGEANILREMGQGTAALMGLGKSATLAGRVASGAVQAGVENAVFQAGDEISKLLSEDPHQSVETALVDIGLSGALGGGIGAGFGAVSPLWKAANESKTGQFIEDFRARLRSRLDNPNPAEAVTNELHGHYNQITSLADEVYGPQGLKAQEIQKLIPEMSPKIESQTQKLVGELDQTLEKLKDDPLVGKLRDKVEQFKSSISPEVDPITMKPTKTPASSEIFNAAQELKQQLQEWGKFNKTLVPLAEKEFRTAAKELSFKLRTALEDVDVWGKAAERQQSINKAFKEYLPALKDFEKRFTTLIGDERVIDPGKINTYLNQVGKPNAEIKQEMLKNFLDASENYKKIISESHANLGIDSPFEQIALDHSKSTLEQVSSGAKLADVLVNKGLANLAGHGLGATIGGAIGHGMGAGAIGALIGEHALGPFLSSILPAIAKPILERPASAEALKTAVDMGLSVIRGEAAISKAARAVFASGQEVVPQALMASDKRREKLKNRLDELQTDVASLINVGGQTGHYMPGQGAALAETAARATQYLNGLKPKQDRLGPLDPPRKPSQVEVSKYNRALDLAEQPLLAVKAIKDGTLTPEDVITVKTLYPAWYSKTAQKLTHEMIDHVAQGETVPYKSRMSLSLFLGQPLDSTLTPQAIMAAQPKGPQESPQAMPAASGRKGSMSSLKKTSSLYQTPLQSRELEKATQS